MATFSFKQNVTIKDSKTSNKILKELKTEKGAFEHIQAKELKDNTEKVASIWFKH